MCLRKVFPVSSFVHTFIHSCIHSFIHSFFLSCLLSFIHSSIHSRICKAPLQEKIRRARIRYHIQVTFKNGTINLISRSYSTIASTRVCSGLRRLLSRWLRGG